MKKVRHKIYKEIVEAYEINQCKACPHIRISSRSRRREGKGLFFECYHDKFARLKGIPPEIPNIYSFPEWCPLEDTK